MVNYSMPVTEEDAYKKKCFTGLGQCVGSDCMGWVWCMDDTGSELKPHLNKEGKPVGRCGVIKTYNTRK